MSGDESDKNTSASEDPVAQAEARRRRILEASQRRMDIASGSSNNEETTTTTTTTTDDVKKSSGNSRLAQMRRRRFKSSSKKAEESSSSVEGAKSEETVKEAEETVKEVETETVEVKPEEDSPKKYLGVAKMRRKRLAEKKASSDNLENLALSSSSDVSIDLKSGHSKMAVLMQLLTIGLLFLSGWDVGHTSVAHRIESDLYVPSWLGGTSTHNHPAPTTTTATATQQRKMYLQESLEDDLAHEEGVDEFGEAKPVGASSRKSDPNNLDPLFGIDMDALVDGKEGLYWSCARFAIAMHRLNLYFFYELPKAILWDLPKRWMATPPILFLLAVLIRAFGKYVLNAHVPELEDILVHKYETTTNNKKILESSESSAADTAAALDPEKMTNMATNFVKNWLQTNFPKAFFLFTVLRDVRQDMYIVLCGLVMGMVANSTTDPSVLSFPFRTSLSNGEL